MQSEVLGDARVVRVKERLYQHDAHDFEDFLRSFKEQGVSKLILDFNDVSHVASLAFGVLATIHNEMREAGGGLVILRPREDIRKLLEMLRLDKVIPIVASRAEAVQKFY